jgi:hypothetical protein
MDISKLPKLSKTSEPAPPPVPADDTQPATAPIHYAVVPSSIGFPEAWISIGLGVLLLFVFPNTIRYIHSPADFESNNPVTDANNNAISYPNSVFFWTDLGVTVFAAALVLEGIVLAAARKIGPLRIAFAVTVLAAIFNVFMIVHAQPVIGFPMICGVGVVVLGYMALTQWRLIAALRE